MRLWGRIPVTAGGDAEQLTAGAPSRWVAVTEDATGHFDYIALTALVQCLKLNLGESPFWGNYGIPAKSSVLQQLPPDYNVALTQAFFAPYFASLIVSKDATRIEPTYQVNVVRTAGSTMQMTVAL